MKRALPLVVVALLASSGLGFAAYKATITPVNPATVPQGFLVANAYLPTRLQLKINKAAERTFKDGAAIYLQHAVIPPGGSTGWHSHAGPVFVLMVNGALTLYNGKDKTCTGHVYDAGKSFVDEGFGNVHIARNEGTTNAEFYAMYLLPNGAGDPGVKEPQTGFTNPACTFPQ